MSKISLFSPNFLFDFNRNFATENLKPRDSAVLNYLLTKPATWKLRAQDIATAINVCERTAYKALKKLQNMGATRYERESLGRTNEVGYRRRTYLPDLKRRGLTRKQMKKALFLSMASVWFIDPISRIEV